MRMGKHTAKDLIEVLNNHKIICDQRIELLETIDKHFPDYEIDSFISLNILIDLKNFIEQMIEHNKYLQMELETLTFIKDLSSEESK